MLWFTGCAIVMVFAYTQLLEYYLELGIDLRTQSSLERIAEEYAGANAEEGATPELPGGPSLAGYLDLADIPPQILAAFQSEKLQHGEALRFMNLSFNENDEKEFELDTLDICPEGTCELLFLYPYQLDDDQWLYLVHGIVGSEEIYEELEFTDQFAFAIGSLFAGLLLLVSFMLVRNIDAPLRKLNSWSASQSADDSDPELPDLRFHEFDALARRIQFAFERMREGVKKEKLFLRHASHELRTPIAILSANVELIDRLTERPERSEAEQAAFVRQYRALDDVRLLIETLLWINRQSDNLPKSEQIDLRSELDIVIENYRYLLDTKDVSVAVDGGGAATAPAAAVRIVLSNLVRNAFQYTVDGEVRITIAPGQVSVQNAGSADLDAHGDGQADEYGFGLGLELVSLICGRFDWRCTTTELPGGRVTVVGF
jgi:signal transduction histidine kinase